MDDEAKDDVVSRENVAEADQAEAEGCRDMLEAAKENKEGAVRHFIRSDVNSVHKTHEEGYTPLHLAAGNGHVGVVQRLLEAKAVANAERNKCGSTPLHFAAFNGHVGVVQRLLEAKAAVDAQDKHGSTPLHFAAWDAHDSVVERLLEAKAAMDVKDADGKTPYNLAKSKGHKKVMGLLHPDGQTSQAKENLKELVQRSLDALGHRSLARENLEVELKDAVLKYAIDSTKARVLLEAGAQQKAADVHLEEKLRETLADLVATKEVLEAD